MPNRGTIIVIDDEIDVLKVLIRRLTDAGYQVFSFQNPLEGLVRAKEIMPELIILDVMMRQLNGMEVKKKFNEDSILNEIPVIFLSAKSTIPTKIEGLHLGAVDYVTKPFQIDEFLARVDSAINRKRHYEKVAVTDPLTGLANIRIFTRQLDTFFNLAKRYQESFALIIIDVNKLKDVNDQFGHKTGDAVLIAVAEAMRNSFRNSDVLVRYAGDEFVVLAPQTDNEHAQKAVERFKEKLKDSLVYSEENRVRVPVAVSAGLAEYEPSIHSPKELFELADKRLYEEKMGRSQKKGDEKTILLIEDEPDISKAIAFRLKKAGYQVVTAKDGKKGLAEATRLNPDLIILDLMLPKLTGEEVCKTLREGDDEVLAKIPILMLTAKSSTVDQIVGRVIGANCYMCKPFEIEILLENVHKLVYSG